MSWKRFIAFGDTHGDMVHQPTLDALTEFIKDYKPHYKIHVGDLFDYRSLRQGIKANESDAYDDLKADTLKGHQILETIQPDVLLLGNHDHRIVRVAEEHANGLMREAAAAGIAHLEKTCRKTKTRIIPYHYNKGVYNIDNIYFTHGYTANQRTVAQHAEYFGSGINSSVIMGHIHRIEVAAGKSLNRATGYSIGCMCNFEGMSYAAHRLATSMWEHGFAYGVTSKKGHQIWIAKKTGDDWILPTKLKTIG
jgi:UDP-2,3-diacylglucosamine pyrophosphatase LpxH